MNYVSSGYVRSGYVRQDNDTIDGITFDRYGKHLYISEDVASIDLTEVYTATKDWLVQDDNTRNLPPIRYSGYDPIPGGYTGATFFMMNGWKLVYNTNTTAITGVLFSDDYDTGYWDYNDLPIFPIIVAATVNTVYKEMGVSGLTEDESVKLAAIPTAEEIWAYVDRTLTESVAATVDAEDIWTHPSRTLTEGSGLDESQLHGALDTYANKDGYKADVSNLSADVNVVEVNGVPVVIEDFKTEETDFHNYLDGYGNKVAWKADVTGVTVDTGAVATAVWSDATRTLTDGFMPADRATLQGIENYDDTALQNAVNSIPTNTVLSTDSRLTNLDAAVSTRATAADVDLGGGFTEIDRTKLNSLENYSDETVLDSIDLAEANISALAITPDQVWAAATRELTQSVSLSTAQSNHLLALENYDDTIVQTKLDTIPLDTVQVDDARLSRLDANISSRATAAEVQITVDGGFTNADRIVLGSLENYDDISVVSTLGIVDTKVSQAKAHTDTLDNYTTLSQDLDNYTNKAHWKADVSTLTAVNTNVNSIKGTVEAISIPDMVTEGEIHTYLDSYPNKTNWKAIVPAIDLTPVLNAISALNDLSLAQVEGSSILAKETTLATITSIVSGIPTTDSVADLTPVLTAISQLNDVTPSQVRAAFDVADFKDKNTEVEVHTWLDSYTGKDSWKADTAAVANEVWNKVV